MKSVPDDRSWPEERRLATVLFADIHGFTAVADGNDVEIVTDMIREIWTRLDTVIENHGGWIDKHLGDGVMAVWGAPTAGEDDAEQAVACGLALLAEMRAWAESCEREDGSGLRLRVGVNSGPVLAGWMGLRPEYTVMGDTVNVASRFETMADPDTLVIGEPTWRMVRGAFQVNRLPPLNLRGKQEAVPAYLVTGREARGQVRFRSAGGLTTRMVARDREWAVLESAWEEVRDLSRPRALLLTGEEGLGKSRLLMEFATHLSGGADDVLVLRTRALAQTRAVSLGLWRGLLHSTCGVSDDAEASDAHACIVQGIHELCTGRGPAPGAAADVPDDITELAGRVGCGLDLAWPGADGCPDADVEEATAALADLVSRIARRTPLVLVLDDLQHADDDSLVVLDGVMERMEDLPVLVLAAARPSFVQDRRQHLQTAQVLMLTHLPDDPQIVAAAYPDMDDLPATVLAELSRRAAGNPYFLEEMVKSLRTGGRAAGELPPGLRNLLQARLDALGSTARVCAMAASVVGRVFWRGAVAAVLRRGIAEGAFDLAADDVDATLAAGLDDLMMAEMAFPRLDGESLRGEQEWIFKHALVQETALQQLTRRNRRVLHRAAAEWLRDRLPDGQLGQVAEHFEQAGMPDEAAEACERAAAHARAHGARTAAAILEGRAEELRAASADA